MQTLALAGSGEFTSLMIEVDTYLLSLINKKNSSPKVVILPTAAGQEKDALKWIKNGINHFQNLKSSPFGLEILNQSDAQNLTKIKKLVDAKLIYFSGGHPGYLLSCLEKSKLWQKIYFQYKKGIVLAGCSAGAMVMGNYVLANAQQTISQNKKPVWKKGLGLMPFTILPHFDWIEKNEPQKLKKIISTAPNTILKYWLGIDEDTVLVITDSKKALVLGKGQIKVSKNGKPKKYSSGEKFNI